VVFEGLDVVLALVVEVMGFLFILEADIRITFKLFLVFKGLKYQRDEKMLSTYKERDPWLTISVPSFNNLIHVRLQPRSGMSKLHASC
jgi:hypothetical protein